jgi:hypothetical protein
MDNAQPTESQPDTPRKGRRRRYTLGALVIGVTIAVLEIFVLHGEVVSRMPFEGPGPHTVVIPVERLGESHLIEIYTSPKASIECSLTAPDGSVVGEIDEMKRHRRHYMELTPTVAGSYELTVSSSRSTLRGRVELLLGDHRVFGPWGYWLGL